MPFNYQALETLLNRPDYNPARLCRHVKNEIGIEIPREYMEQWAKGRNLGAITAEQIDALDQYARKHGYNDLPFYKPSPETPAVGITAIGNFRMPIRVRKQFQIRGIFTIEELCNQTESSLKGRNFGETSLNWVREFLAKQGRQLSKE